MATEWLDGTSASRLDPAGRLNALLARGSSVAVPGAYDGLSALLAKKAGFEALYLSGAALSASMGLPDLGMLTLEDLKGKARELVRASGLPLIADCDTGFGEVLSVMRTVRELEEVGAACVQIEDQKLPKKCGHLNDKTLVETSEMCAKVEAAKRASGGIAICARTDAAAVSLDEAISRANRYAEAGADLIFVEALTSHDDMRRVRAEVKAPLLANMTEFGRTPPTNLATFDAMGFELVIYPVSAFRAASRAGQLLLNVLKRQGEVGPAIETMMPRAELYDVIGYFDYEALDAKIAHTVLDTTEDLKTP